jgi:hypothetical protein
MRTDEEKKADKIRNANRFLLNNKKLLEGQGKSLEEIQQDYLIQKYIKEGADPALAGLEPVKQEAQADNLRELKQAAKDHKAGNCVDSEKVFQAYKAGFLSESDAMNSDF